MNLSHKIEDLNKEASNNSGVRPDYMYKNILDQKRYIDVLSCVHEKKVLDCACGVGWGSYIMATSGAAHVTGVDLSKVAISTAKKYYNYDSVLYIQDDIGNLPNQKKFDILTSFETIEHVEDPVGFLKILANLSHKETVFFLSTPNGFCFKNKGDSPYNPYHNEEYTKEELYNLFSLSGWFVVEYKGQHLMKENTQEIVEYRSFIRRFWQDKARSDRFGITYTLLGKIIRRVLGNAISDPAHKRDCTPTKVCKGYQPAYHYFKLKLK